MFELFTYRLPSDPNVMPRTLLSPPVHDLHTTLLHLLGFDYTKLTCRSQDRAFRLADVHSRIVKKLLV